MATAFTRYFQNLCARRILSLLQKLIGLAAVVFLVVKLSHIGWHALWAAPTAHVASMFVAAGALSLLTHAVVFGVTGLFKREELKVQPA